MHRYFKYAALFIALFLVANNGQAAPPSPALFNQIMMSGYKKLLREAANAGLAWGTMEAMDLLDAKAEELAEKHGISKYKAKRYLLRAVQQQR